MIDEYINASFDAYDVETFKVNPNCFIILSKVSNRGVVLLDSIRAIEDCGISQSEASSL